MLILGSGGFPFTPLTIVAVVVSYIAASWLTTSPVDETPLHVPQQPAGRAEDLPAPAAR